MDILDRQRAMWRGPAELLRAGARAGHPHALEPHGRSEAARAELLAVYESANEATDGAYHAEAEHLVTVVHRAA